MAAAALVGGAFLSSFLNVVFDRLSSPEVVDLIQGKKLDQKLLQRLETALYVVQAVLNDAEQKQIADPAVKKWLANLEDAVYVADDLLDELSTKAAIQKKKNAGTFFSRFLSLQDREMVSKIKEVIDRLEEYAKHKDILGLEKIAKENISWRIPSTSLVEKSDIYGRDEDKDAIIKLLLDDTCDAKISVIPLVGMGGVGKTTLAQLVFNDDKVKGKFDFKIWVCVSEQFDVVKVTKTIIEAVTSITCDKNDLNLLQIDLKERLTGNKFLIVLDDVWNDHFDGWSVLQKPFQYGDKGSKVLVTTRSDKVASMVQTVPAYKLSLLSDEDCWSVFVKHAFPSAESKDYPALEQTARKIVEKCKGLPLAAQTLGCLLRTKNDVRDWNNIVECDFWKFSEDKSKIIPALRISYHYLPSHLKRCFVYCSLYPKDYQFEKDELIMLWIAEDLLQTSEDGRTLEEMGYEYFDELVSRSLFQPHSTNENLFVLHHLMHDLATFCAGEFYFRAEGLGNAMDIGIKTRHVSHNARGNYPLAKLLAACDRVKHIRTFLELNSSHWDPCNMENASSILLSKLKHLRVLSFNSFPLDHDSLPDSIGELIHLRCLDLSNTPITVLPESLSNLYNLLTLKLNDCYWLKMLPSGMQDLVNLRHLDISRTGLEKMPKGMSKLKHLQRLSDYIVGKHELIDYIAGKPEENGIRELGALADLHGSLSISKLENVVNGGDALKASMIDKKHINNLCFNWSLDDDIADSQFERDILDKLQPHRNLKKLTIEGYRGTIFSDWLGHSSYHNMTQLALHGCKNCCMLPSLGQFPSLKHLTISNFDWLEIIGVEFYKNDESCQETPFPSLEKLEFCHMSCWQKWPSFESNAFPHLKQLSISNCPMLVGDLPNCLPALEKLIIRECKKLACSLPIASNIYKLRILGEHKVKMQELPLSLHSLSISGYHLVENMLKVMNHTQLTRLQSLSISNCSSSISSPLAYLPPSLQKLEIRHCKKLEFPMQQQHKLLQLITIVNSCDSLSSFPLETFPNITKLRIRSCENMKSLVVPKSHDVTLSSFRSLSIQKCPSFVSFSMLGMAAPQLNYLRIECCPEIVSLPEGGMPRNLRELHIIESEKLVSCLALTDLHSHGLNHLHISGACDSVKSFPKESLLPVSLQSLHLLGLSSLETFDCKGLVHLTSLQILTITECPKVDIMARESLPASLLHISINGSPLPGEYNQMKDQPVWPKISRIHGTKVDLSWTS